MIGLPHGAHITWLGTVGCLKDTSTSERAQKRRAAAACKSPKALREASIANEAECTKRVLGGDTQVMLSALERLGPACKADATHVCQ